MSQKNEPIGEVECIAKGCTERCDVFRYRAREAEKMRRFAGKLYFRCPRHGKYGDGISDADVQEYILTKGTIWGDRKSADEKPAEPAATPPAAPAAKAEKLPATRTPTPAKKAPAVPARKAPAAPAATPAEPAKKPSGWGFF